LTCRSFPGDQWDCWLKELKFGDGFSGEVSPSPQEPLHIALPDPIPSAVSWEPPLPYPPFFFSPSPRPGPEIPSRREETTSANITRSVQGEDLESPEEDSKGRFDGLIHESQGSFFQEIDKGCELVIEQQGTPLVQENPFSDPWASARERSRQGGCSSVRGGVVLVITGAEEESKEEVIELTSEEFEILSEGRDEGEREQGMIDTRCRAEEEREDRMTSQ
jgi:hypothetical protein